MAAPRATTVEEYLAALPDVARRPFTELLETVRGVEPAAAQLIKWGAPVFELRRILYSLSAFKDHMNFVPTTKTLTEFHAEIDALGLRRTDGVLHLAYDAPVPVDLVRRIAERRAWDVRENDARFAV